MKYDKGEAGQYKMEEEFSPIGRLHMNVPLVQRGLYFFTSPTVLLWMFS